MIYVIYGRDRTAVKAAADTLLAAQLKKYPALTIFRFSADDYSPERLEEICLGQMLWAEKFAAQLIDFLAAPEKILTERLTELNQSPNLYLLLEGELKTEILAAVAAAGGRVRAIKQSAAQPNGQSLAGFNPFALADALGERDRQRAWILFQTALARGLAPEEIFWKLVWKVKTLLLVQTAADPAALGLKPFVLAQARRHNQNFKLAELKKLSARLVALWHNHHRGLLDFELGLERLVLEL